MSDAFSLSSHYALSLVLTLLEAPNMSHTQLYIYIYNITFFYVFLLVHPTPPSFSVKGLRPWQGLHVEGLSRSWCRNWCRERTLGHLGLEQYLAFGHWDPISRSHGSEPRHLRIGKLVKRHPRNSAHPSIHIFLGFCRVEAAYIPLTHTQHPSA